jgi:hypothetical protein
VVSLLSLSVLDLTTSYALFQTLRKSSLSGLLGDLGLLLSLLLDISNSHTSNSSLDLEGLLASLLALFSSL